MRIQKLLMIGLVGFLFASCEKKEEPVEPATGRFIEAAIGPAYDQQLYFNVLTGTFVKKDVRDTHDLLFEGATDGRHIYLASTNFPFLKNMGPVPFGSVTDTAGGKWLYDYPNGKGYRSAFGEWFNSDGSSKNEVFVMDLGYDAKGNRMGYRKISVLSVDATQFTLRYSMLDNTQDTIVSIPKDPERYLVGFSLRDHKVIDAQPISKDWHLLFTQYTDFDLTQQGDTQAYLVRGVLINPENTEGLFLQDTKWEGLDRDASLGREFVRDWNVIGYRWKYYDFDAASYKVRDNYHYLIKEKSGNWFKIRFVGFYNDQGEKGYPRFEIEGL